MLTAVLSWSMGQEAGGTRLQGDAGIIGNDPGAFLHDCGGNDG